MYPNKHSRRHDYDTLMQAYRNCIDFADLLDAAGNKERAEEVRETCRMIAREKMIDRVLTPES